MVDSMIAITCGATLLVTSALTASVLSCFRKCGPNQAMVISGLGTAGAGSAFRIVQGGGAVVYPLVQQASYLNLEVMTINVRNTTPMHTKNGVPINLKLVAQIKIGSSEKSLALAARHLLDKSEKDIKDIAYDAIIGRLQAAVGTMELERILSTLTAFGDHLATAATADLDHLGLVVVALTINEIKDEVGYLEQVGRKQTLALKTRLDAAEAALA